MNPLYAGALAGVGLLVGYISLSYALWRHYYEPEQDDQTLSTWKNQPKNRNTLTPDRKRKDNVIPMLSLIKQGINTRVQHKHPLHNLFASVNLTISSLFAGVTVYCIMADISRVHFEFDRENVTGQVCTILFMTLAMILHESVVEYYWHVLMHTKLCYRHLHKYHHYYTSPMPFDDLFIHPLEGFGYQCILWSPPFLYSQHYLVFVLYMVIMGITGILDHCGIHFEIPNIYNTKDHDLHHEYFNVNFGFPTIFLDILHGTYLGHYGGRSFVPKYKKIVEHRKHS